MPVLKNILKRITNDNNNISTMMRILIICILINCIFISTTHAQIGEIASLVTGLLGSGGGLAGLAGGGASAGSAAAGAASGASGVLSGIGPLYQLAQAALQLTGTGVGIANQASESAWFPVAVENAARMNRDFQERLLKTGGIGSGAGEFGGRPSEKGSVNNKISTEYGKNFESSEEVSEKTTNNERSGTSFPRENSGSLFPLPSNLPGLTSLLPGESSFQTREIQPRRENRPTSQSISSSSNQNGIEPLVPEQRRPFSTSSSLTGHEEFESKNIPHINIELPPKRTNLEKHNVFTSGEQISKTKDNESVQINYDYEHNDKDAKPVVDFNIDDDDTDSTALNKNITRLQKERSDFELLAKPTVRGSVSKAMLSVVQRVLSMDEKSKNASDTDVTNAAKLMANMLTDEIKEDHKIPHMVPELQNLITALRSSNLSREEFIEIAKQLEINTDPRTNTTPFRKLTTRQDFEESGENTQKRSRDLKPRNEKREHAAIRNLQALHTAYSHNHNDDPVLRNIEINDSQTPPVIMSLPRRQNLYNTRNLRPKTHAVVPYPRQMIDRENLTALVKGKYDVENTDKKASTSSVREISSTNLTTLPILTSTLTSLKEQQQTYQTNYPNPQFSFMSTPSPFIQQQQDLLAQHHQQTYNNLYKAYINFYYPQYTQYYGTSNGYNQYPQQQFQYAYTQQSAPIYNPQQQPQTQQYYTSQTHRWDPQRQNWVPTVQQERSVPARVVSQPIVTTPPSSLQHPYSQGALLTLMQPQSYFWGR